MRFRTERERLAYEQWKRQDDEEQQRPIREAEAQAKRLHGDLIKVQRSNILDIRDPDFYVSPGFELITMEMEPAQRFNGDEATAFVNDNPDYYPSQRNSELLMDYMSRNQCTIIGRNMWKAAFERFKAVGLLEERPSAEPIVEVVQPQPELDLESLPRLPLSYQRPSGWQRQSDGAQEGYDLKTGEPRVFTALEIDKMTGDEYRRAFRLSIPALTKANFTQ